MWLQAASQPYSLALLPHYLSVRLRRLKCPKIRRKIWNGATEFGTLNLKPKGDCWFSIKWHGCIALDNMIKEMCKSAGICATKLTIPCAQQQLPCYIRWEWTSIMKRTGHRSFNGVHSYKFTSEEQREKPSNIINDGVARTQEAKFGIHATDSLPVLIPNN